jgi:hypothetical protein
MAVSSGPKITKDGLVLYLDAANFESFRGEPTTNLLSSFSPNVTQQVIKGEFGQYYNLVSIFETYGLVPYSLSFDMKATKPGNVLWYMQNSSYTKYGFVYHWRYATTEWQRFKIENITPDGPRANWQANTPNDNRAMLATYTIYGSGIRPIVKNIQIELGSKATAFVSGSRGTTVATGGGWADMTNNGNHGQLINGTSYDSGSLGALNFDGIDDYISVGALSGSFSSFTVITWFYPKSISNYENVLDCNYSYNGTTGNIGPRLEINSTGQLEWFYSNITDSNSSFYRQRVVLSGLSVNTWHFAAITYDGNLNSSKTYYNGNNTNFTRTNSGSPTGFIGTFNNVILGKGFHLGGSERVYTGNVSSTQIYNRALSDTEIKQIYEATRARYGL